MEALFASLVSKYGFDYAAKLLGIDKQTENPKYAISLGNFTFDPVNALKRSALNKGIQSIMSGKLSNIMGPAVMLGGALMLGRAFDPLRPGSKNYNPYLGDQISYLEGKENFIGRNPSSGNLQYGPASVLSGQNVVSMFGTNSYIGQLEKKKDYFENQISKGKNYSQRKYEQTLKELKEAKQNELMNEIAEEEKARKRANYSPPYQSQVHKEDKQGNNNNTGSTSQSSGLGSGHSGSGYQGRSGSHHYKRGGIANL